MAALGELKPLQCVEALRDEGEDDEEEEEDCYLDVGMFDVHDLCGSDDSDDDPTFDIVEETRSALSKVSLKKPKPRKVSKADEEDGSDCPEVEIPELDAEDRKCFEVVEKLIKDGQLEKLKVDQCKVYLRKYGLRLTGKKDILTGRIKEHLEIRDGGGETKYPISSFVVNCKGDACTGDVVMFEQNVYEMFSIASRSAIGPPCGTRLVVGKIVKESYGAAKQQHTFTIEVLWSKGERPLPPLHPLLIKGRNLYRLKTMRQRWTDEEDRRKVLQEKHARGSLARFSRENRIQEKKMRRMDRFSRIKEIKTSKTPKAQEILNQVNPFQAPVLQQGNPPQHRLNLVCSKALQQETVLKGILQYLQTGFDKPTATQDQSVFAQLHTMQHRLPSQHNLNSVNSKVLQQETIHKKILQSEPGQHLQKSCDKPTATQQCTMQNRQSSQHILNSVKSNDMQQATSLKENLGGGSGQHLNSDCFQSHKITCITLEKKNHTSHTDPLHRHVKHHHQHQSPHRQHRQMRFDESIGPDTHNNFDRDWKQSSSYFRSHVITCRTLEQQYHTFDADQSHHNVNRRHQTLQHSDAHYSRCRQPLVSVNSFHQSPPSRQRPARYRESCRFYRQGRCYFGEECKYLHD